MSQSHQKSSLFPNADDKKSDQQALPLIHNGNKGKVSQALQSQCSSKTYQMLSQSRISGPKASVNSQRQSGICNRLAHEPAFVDEALTSKQMHDFNIRTAYGEFPQTTKAGAQDSSKKIIGQMNTIQNQSNYEEVRPFSPSSNYSRKGTVIGNFNAEARWQTLSPSQLSHSQTTQKHIIAHRKITENGEDKYHRELFKDQKSNRKFRYLPTTKNVLGQNELQSRDHDLDLPQSNFDAFPNKYQTTNEQWLEPAESQAQSKMSQLYNENTSETKPQLATIPMPEQDHDLQLLKYSQNSEHMSSYSPQQYLHKDNFKSSQQHLSPQQRSDADIKRSFMLALISSDGFKHRAAKDAGLRQSLGESSLYNLRYGCNSKATSMTHQVHDQHNINRDEEAFTAAVVDFGTNSLSSAVVFGDGSLPAVALKRDAATQLQQPPQKASAGRISLAQNLKQQKHISQEPAITSPTNQPKPSPLQSSTLHQAIKQASSTKHQTPKAKQPKFLKNLTSNYTTKDDFSYFEDEQANQGSKQSSTSTRFKKKDQKEKAGAIPDDIEQRYMLAKQKYMAHAQLNVVQDPQLGSVSLVRKSIQVDNFRFLSACAQELQQYCKDNDGFYAETRSIAQNIIKNNHEAANESNQQVFSSKKFISVSKSPMKTQRIIDGMKKENQFVRNTQIYSCNLKNLAKTCSYLMQSSDFDTITAHKQRKQQIANHLCHPPQRLEAVKPSANAFAKALQLEQHYTTTLNAAGAASNVTEWNQLKKMLVKVVDIYHTAAAPTTTDAATLPANANTPPQTSHTIKSIENTHQTLVMKLENSTNLLTVEDDFYIAIEKDLDHSKQAEESAKMLPENATDGAGSDLSQASPDAGLQQQFNSTQGFQGEQDGREHNRSTNKSSSLVKQHNTSIDGEQQQQVMDEKEMLKIYIQKRKQLQTENLFDAYNTNSLKSRKPQKSGENFPQAQKKQKQNPYEQSSIVTAANFQPVQSKKRSKMSPVLQTMDVSFVTQQKHFAPHVLESANKDRAAGLVAQGEQAQILVQNQSNMLNSPVISGGDVVSEFNQTKPNVAFEQNIEVESNGQDRGHGYAQNRQNGHDNATPSEFQLPELSEQHTRAFKNKSSRRENASMRHGAVFLSQEIQSLKSCLLQPGLTSSPDTSFLNLQEELQDQLRKYKLQNHQKLRQTMEFDTEELKKIYKPIAITNRTSKLIKQREQLLGQIKKAQMQKNEVQASPDILESGEDRKEYRECRLSASPVLPLEFIKTSPGMQKNEVKKVLENEVNIDSKGMATAVQGTQKQHSPQNQSPRTIPDHQEQSPDPAGTPSPQLAADSSAQQAASARSPSGPAAVDEAFRQENKTEIQFSQKQSKKLVFELETKQKLEIARLKEIQSKNAQLSHRIISGIRGKAKTKILQISSKSDLEQEQAQLRHQSAAFRGGKSSNRNSMKNIMELIESQRTPQQTDRDRPTKTKQPHPQPIMKIVTKGSHSRNSKSKVDKNTLIYIQEGQESRRQLSSNRNSRNSRSMKSIQSNLRNLKHPTSSTATLPHFSQAPQLSQHQQSHVHLPQITLPNDFNTSPYMKFGQEIQAQQSKAADNDTKRRANRAKKYAELTYMPLTDRGLESCSVAAPIATTQHSQAQLKQGEKVMDKVPSKRSLNDAQMQQKKNREYRELLNFQCQEIISGRAGNTQQAGFTDRGKRLAEKIYKQPLKNYLKMSERNLQKDYHPVLKREASGNLPSRGRSGAGNRNPRPQPEEIPRLKLEQLDDQQGNQ